MKDQAETPAWRVREMVRWRFQAVISVLKLEVLIVFVFRFRDCAPRYWCVAALFTGGLSGRVMVPLHGSMSADVFLRLTLRSSARKTAMMVTEVRKKKMP